MRTVLIGLGMVAGMHVDAIAGTGGAVKLHGIFGRDPARADAFARDHGLSGVRRYRAIDEIAGDPAVDFVIIATPPDARLDLIAPLADAGKPILLEKPIERSYPQARDVVEHCRAAGVSLGIVLQHRMRPAAIRLRDLLQRGALGPIAIAELRVPWWRDQSYYDETGRGTYARDGGGVLITQAIHALDLLLHLAGPVSQVQAMTRTSSLHRMEAEDFAAAGLVFASGALGSVTATTAGFPGGAERIELQCEKGAAVLSASQLTVHWRSGRTETFGETGESGAGADPMAFSHAWHQAIIEDFARALTDNRPPCAPGRDALLAQGLIDAIQLSSARGRMMNVNEVQDV